MKSLVFVIALLFVVSCVDKNDGVKIIENYDATYLTDDQVDEEAGNDKELEILQADLENTISEIAKKNELPAKAYVNLRVYINENGKVDGVKELPIKSGVVEKEEGVNIIPNDELTKVIAMRAKYWDFKPAFKDGKKVKFRDDLEMVYSVSKDGKITGEIAALKSMGKALSELSSGESNNVYYVAVEDQPTPIGGLKAIQEKIIYPLDAKQKGIQGRVFVKAYINENGNVDRAEILKGISSDCDSAAMKAIMDTKFKPGKQRGKAVKVQVSIPIIFQLR